MTVTRQVVLASCSLIYFLLGVIVILEQFVDVLGKLSLD